MIHNRGVRPVHLSIDLVFSGTGVGGHVERDPTDPVTVYGKTVAAAERLILMAEPGRRDPADFAADGRELQRACEGRIDWIQSRLKKHRPATLYFDEVRMPTYTDCLNGACEAVLGSSLAGLFHAGGPRRLSLYHGECPDRVVRARRASPRLPLPLLLYSSRAETCPLPPNLALGRDAFDPWPLQEDWLPTHLDWHYERNGERGSPGLLAEVLYRNPGKNQRRFSGIQAACGTAFVH